MSDARRFSPAPLVMAAALAIGYAYLRGYIGPVGPGPQPGPEGNVPESARWLGESTFAEHPGDAQLVGGLLAGIAEFIEEDGADAEPRLTSVFAVADYLDAALGAPPAEMEAEHTDALARIGRELELGEGSEPLSASLRRQAVETLRGFAAALEGIK